MFNRFTKAFMALLVVLLITLGCLAFMPWEMEQVIPQLSDARKCIVTRYDKGSYSVAYPKGEALEEIADSLRKSTGHFDRKRENIFINSGQVLYRIYLQDSKGLLPEIHVSGDVLFFENSQYLLDEEDAMRLNEALSDCFK